MKVKELKTVAVSEMEEARIEVIRQILKGKIKNIIEAEMMLGKLKKDLKRFEGLDIDEVEILDDRY